MNERETAQHFYEMLTGVFDDEQSKIFRYICFGVLFAGIIWSGWYYFRAQRLSDTTTPLDPDMYTDLRPRSDNSPLKRIVDLASTIDTMRSAGGSIAQAIDRLHHMPFNTDPEGGLERTDDPGESLSSSPQETPLRADPVNVKMIMTGEDGEKLAVVDVDHLKIKFNNISRDNGKGLIVRQGDELPYNGGFVKDIRSNGITVIFNGEEKEYDMLEIPMLEIPKNNGLKKPGKKSH